MSSDYHLICLSNDPALVLASDDAWHSGHDGRAVAERALLNPATCDKAEVRAHAGCHLVIGAYSYPLVSVGWRTYGDKVKWVDAAWLRPLALLTHEPVGVEIPHGWTWTDARRLRQELRMEGATDTQSGHDSEAERYYELVCSACDAGPNGPASAMRFGRDGDRERWADEHREATGHNAGYWPHHEP